MSTQQRYNLWALLRHCVAVRDLPNAAAACALLMTVQPPSMFKVVRDASRKAAQLLQCFLLDCIAELVMAAGQATGASGQQIQQLLMKLLPLQWQLEGSERLMMEVAGQLLIKGEVEGALDTLAAPLTTCGLANLHLRLLKQRTALQGLVRHRQWLSMYEELSRQGQAAAAGQPTSGAPAPPPALAHDREVWARAWAQRPLREAWREGERLLREAVRGLKGSTQLSYALVHTYIVAGRIHNARAAARAAAETAPGDADALALALTVERFVERYDEALARYEAEAGLAPGAAAAAYGFEAIAGHAAAAAGDKDEAEGEGEGAEAVAGGGGGGGAGGGGRPRGARGGGGGDEGGGVHGVVRWQLQALEADPTCAAALAGLQESSPHCPGCCAALVQGCLLHLDMCTGYGAAPHEAETWQLLAGALQQLAQAAVTAAQDAAAAGAGAGPSDAAGSGRAQQEGAQGRKRRRGQQAPAAAPPPPPPAVVLWQQQVQPQLEDRSHWWMAAQFAHPPDATHAEVAVAAVAAQAPAQQQQAAARPRRRSSSGALAAEQQQPPEQLLQLTDERGRPFAFPAVQWLQQLQHRAAVAVHMLGPYNLYTQHALQQLYALQQAIANARPMPSAAAASAVAPAAGQGQGQQGDAEDADAAALAAAQAARSAAVLAARESLLRRVSAALAPVLEAVACAEALCKALLAPVGSREPPRQQVQELPPALLAAVPRSLRRAAPAAGDGAAGAP